MKGINHKYNEKYIKSFSKGQITLPKEFRDSLGLEDGFWLRMSVVQGKIVAEPINTKVNKKDLLQKLKKVDGNWFSDKDHKDMRKDLNKRTKRYEW